MKKTSSLLIITLLVLLCVGPASATLFTDYKPLNVWIAEGPIADLFTPKSHSYFHDTPADLHVPQTYTINSATLTIWACLVDGSKSGPNDPVYVDSAFVGHLVPGKPKLFNAPTASVFDVASALNPWNGGDLLDVKVSAVGSWWDGKIYLKSSKLEIDYSPVPEPATMLLLGISLIGVAGFSRRKFKIS